MTASAMPRSRMAAWATALGFAGAGGFADIFEDIFGDMMGGRQRRSSGGRERGADLRYNMEITLEEAYAGKTAQIRVPASISCTDCSGSGAKPGTAAGDLLDVLRRRPRSRRARASSRSSAPARSATAAARPSRIPCPKCAGQGRVIEERSLSVNIPAGIEDGTRIRLANEGEAGLRGGPPGDLYIFLSVKPHEFFQRDGADLYCKVPISMTTAALGGSFEVATLDGTQTRVKVPEGSQNGRQFRLKGKGMPVMRQPNDRRPLHPGRGRDAAEPDQAPARAARGVREDSRRRTTSRNRAGSSPA